MTKKINIVLHAHIPYVLFFVLELQLDDLTTRELCCPLYFSFNCIEWFSLPTSTLPLQFPEKISKVNKDHYISF